MVAFDFITFFINQLIFEPVHDKTYNKTCVTSKDSDQPLHQHRMARVLVYPLETGEGTCNQRRLIRLCGCAG